MNKIWPNICSLVLLAFTIVMSNSTWANTLYSGETIMKNLGKMDYVNKAEVSADIKKLAEGKEDIYSLSIPLIASAQQGDKEFYAVVLAKMNAAMAKTEDSPFKAWILGRVLLAADSIGDQTTINDTQVKLSKVLNDISSKIKPSTELDYAMYTWANAYLAALNSDQYLLNRDRMLLTANNLSKIYQSNPNPDALSNAVWAWVMSVQAAANANDKTTYDYILSQIKTLSGKPTVQTALEFSLGRTDQSSDYPAWAIGIVRLSAATEKDQSQYNELGNALENSIQAAKDWGTKPNQTSANQWKATAEATLGRLNAELAKAHYQVELQAEEQVIQTNCVRY